MLNWLAPAAACMLLVLAAFRQENSGLGQPPRYNPAVAMMLSNQNSVVYLTGESSQMAHNLLSLTFEFTNRIDSALNEGLSPFTKPNQ